MNPLLRIVLHGLIALVPFDSATSTNRMTALLVDARAFPAGVDPDSLPIGYKQCFVPHMAMLSIDLNDQNECRAIHGCKVDSTHCNCMLSRQDLTLEVTPTPSLTMRNLDSPATSLPLPFDQDEAASFHYVANLTTRLGQQLDPRFLDTIPPDPLAARMSFPFDSVTSCALALRFNEGSRNVHALSFRPAGSPEESGETSQALSQQVIATLPIPDQAQVVLNVRDFASSTSLPLTLKPNATGLYSIELSNMREADTLVDDPCDDGVARDFAFFYELALNKLEWSKRKIPHIKMTQWKSSSDLDPDVCSKIRTHAPSSRPICPMAGFDLSGGQQ